jgi:hypothetical protein
MEDVEQRSTPLYHSMILSHWLSLPTEIITYISRLRPLEIDCVAHNHNKTVAPICLSFVHEHVSSAKNLKVVAVLFGDLETMMDFALTYTSAGLASECFPFSVPALLLDRHPITLDYLDLHGDLLWLAPLNQYTVEVET